MSIKSIQNILTYIVSFGLLAFLTISAVEYTQAFRDPKIMAQIGQVSFWFYLQYYLPVVLYYATFGYSVYWYRKTKDVQYFTLAPLVWLFYVGLLVVYNFLASYFQ